jgi:hypothetical protein
MAMVIYGEQATQAAWSSASRWMKDRMCRAAAKGEYLRDGGYRNLLQRAQSGRLGPLTLIAGDTPARSSIARGRGGTPSTA